MTQPMDTQTFRYIANGRAANRRYKRAMENKARQRRSFQKEFLKKYDVEHTSFYGTIAKEGDSIVFYLDNRVNGVPRGVYREYANEYGAPIWTEIRNGSVREIEDHLISRLWSIFQNHKKYNVNKLF